MDEAPVPDTMRELRDAANDLARHLEHNVRNRGRRLELHRYPDRSLTEREQACLMSVRESSVEGELEFDEATVVSDSSDEPGAYVLGWYWIDEVSCGSGS